MRKKLFGFFLASSFLLNMAGNLFALSAGVLDGARALRSEGKFDEALAIYEKALSKDPDNADLLLEFAQTNAWARRDARALELYDKIIARHPNHSDAWLGKAFLLSWRKEYAEAETHFAKVIQLSPDYIDAYVGYAKMLVWQGEYEKAAPLFERAVQFDPSRQEIHAELGQIYAHVFKLDAAVTELEKSIALKSARVDDYVTLGRVYAYSNRLEDSKKLYLEAIRQDASNLDALNGLARTYGYAREWKKSEDAFNAVLKKSPGDPEAKEGLDRLKRLGAPEVTTRFTFVRSRDDDPDNPPQFEYLQMGPDAQLILKKNPDNALILRGGRFEYIVKNLDSGLTRIRANRTEAGIGARAYLPGKIQFHGRVDLLELYDIGENYISRGGARSFETGGFAVVERSAGRHLLSAVGSKEVSILTNSGRRTWDPASTLTYSVSDDIDWFESLSTLFQGGQNFYVYNDTRRMDLLARARYRLKDWPFVFEYQTRFRDDPHEWSYTGSFRWKGKIKRPDIALDFKYSLDRNTLAGTWGHRGIWFASWNIYKGLSFVVDASLAKNFGFKGATHSIGSHFNYAF